MLVKKIQTFWGDYRNLLFLGIHREIFALPLRYYSDDGLDMHYGGTFFRWYVVHANSSAHLPPASA
jgi:hypothetical protein